MGDDWQFDSRRGKFRRAEVIRKEKEQHKIAFAKREVGEVIEAEREG